MVPVLDRLVEARFDGAEARSSGEQGSGPMSTLLDAALRPLYSDSELLILNKPSGLLVHRGWANDDVTALSLARELAGCYVYPVHRLDRSASGVLVFALSPELAKLTQAALVGGSWSKHYVALVRGITPEHGRIDYPLASAKGKPKKPAVTEYARLGTFERYSWLGVKPLTGRTHQIRRHLRHASHPLIGDVRYGKAEHNRLFRERFELQRLCLHALHLRLPHPRTGHWLEITAPLSEDLSEPLARMGLGDCTERHLRSLGSRPPERGSS